MIDIEVSGNVERIVAPCLKLRFEWMADHWKHELVSTGSCASIPRIWSLEGGHDLDDPTRVNGPIYQQLNIKRDSDEVVHALLVGQAGPHHFSSSFTVREIEDGVEIDVDLADRCRSPVESLAVTYLIEASDADLLADDRDGSASLSWRHPESRLEFAAEAPAVVASREATKGTIRFQAIAALKPGDQTHRLRYSWRWTHKVGRQIWDHTA
jgi:hypothetical protein